MGVRDDELHPETPRPRTVRRKASHESYDSVSTTSTPRTRPLAARVAADGGDNGGGGDAPRGGT